MPRMKRIVPCNSALHVICRGNNRNIVFHTDSDKLRYYTLLSELKSENKIDVLHYCLMGNHVHLILSLREESKLSKFMKQLNLTYFHYYRKLYGYFGHLWQDRFKSNIIEMDSHLLQCGKYIELNPVRAGIVSYPAEYIFSSFNFYSAGRPDTLITQSPAYLGISDSVLTRQKLYVDFVIDSSIINSNMLKKNLYIGSKSFIVKLEECYRVRNRRVVRGRPSKQENRTVPFILE